MQGSKRMSMVVVILQCVMYIMIACKSMISMLMIGGWLVEYVAADGPGERTVLGPVTAGEKVD